MGRTAIIVVSHNSLPLLRSCLDSLRGTDPDRAIEIVVVDNASIDGTTEAVADECRQARLIRSDSNLGYGGAANEALKRLGAEYLIISNVDVIYPAASLGVLVGHLDGYPDVGAVGPQQIYPDGSWQRSSGKVPSMSAAICNLLGVTSLKNLRAMSARGRGRRILADPVDVEYLDGAVLALRRRALEEIGAFDSAFPFYAEDADLCQRLRKAGWRVTLVPDAEVVHLRGQSSTRQCPDRFARALAAAETRFVMKHFGHWSARLYAWLMCVYFYLRHLICELRLFDRAVGSEHTDWRAAYFRAMSRGYAGSACLRHEEGL